MSFACKVLITYSQRFVPVIIVMGRLEFEVFFFIQLHFKPNLMKKCIYMYTCMI